MHQIIYVRPRRLGLRTAQAARLAKQLNDAADGRFVAWLTISGDLAVDRDLLQDLVDSDLPRQHHRSGCSAAVLLAVKHSVVAVPRHSGSEAHTDRDGLTAVREFGRRKAAN